MDIVLDLDHGGLGYRCATPERLAAAGVPDDIVLGVVKQALKLKVDEEAERRRLRLVTPGSGQAMEYQEALAQAEKALSLPKTKPPSEGDFPMLDASVGIDLDPITGAPAADQLGVARSIKAASQVWLPFGAEIRRLRLTGKAAIDAATSVAAAIAAFTAIAWPAQTG